VALEGGRIGSVAEPTLDNVRSAVARLSARNRADRAAGHSVDAYVIYVGHGDTDESGNAFLTLLGTRLEPQRLYAEVVDRLDADYVHLVVDACHAAGVVGARRGDAAVLERLRAHLSQELLAARPRVGALYAQSQDGETHEWSRLRAGLFSHVLRSALLGAGDVNGDGLVTYSELEAFVAASIRGPLAQGPTSSFRFSTGARAGSQLDRPRARRSPPGAAWARPTPASRWRTSGRAPGGRPPGPGGDGGPRASPRDTYWLYVPEGDARVARSQLGLRCRRRCPVLRPARVADSLVRGLFASPFDRSFYEGYTVSSGLVPVEFKEQPAPAPTREVGPLSGTWA
jgi:hypothetical protein